MEVKVAGTCMYWSQHLASQSTFSSHTSLASAVSSTLSSPSSSKKRSGIRRTPLLCRIVHQSPLLRTTSTTNISRTESCKFGRSKYRTLRKAVSTNSDGFFDDDFAREIEELAKKLDIVNDNEDENKSSTENSSNSRDGDGESSNHTSYSSFDEELSKISETINHLVQNNRPFPPLNIDSKDSSLTGKGLDPLDWAGLNYLIPASVEMKANSVDLPLSLRILRRKNQLQEEFREAGESAYCSMKKAFNSMVFIIRELHSYTLQMREFLCYEDLQGIFIRVQKEVHASFVWLFQQIFSHTPNLMVYVMILLANFTVHSMAQNAAIAAYPRIDSYSTITEIVSTATEIQNQDQDQQEESKLDMNGKITSLGGNKGGGGNIKSVANSETDGNDGRFNGFSSINHHNIIRDEISKLISFGNPSTNQEKEMEKDELELWHSIVEEASKMQEQSRNSVLNHKTTPGFSLPVKIDINPDLNNTKFFKREIIYQQALLQEPTNPLILSNYAQFLYLVVHDHDRAEEYFKKATSIEPADAEILSHYADFLWMAKKDIGGAEERYLEAIEADPGNMFHASSYAKFLWNTGGVDTCFPLGSINENNET